jgi:hypothetical protein
MMDDGDPKGVVILFEVLKSEFCVTLYEVPFGATQYWYYVGGSFAIMLFVGAASGLHVGLLRIEPLELSILKINGSTSEKKRAEKLLYLQKVYLFPADLKSNLNIVAPPSSLSIITSSNKYSLGNASNPDALCVSNLCRSYFVCHCDATLRGNNSGSDYFHSI